MLGFRPNDARKRYSCSKLPWIVAAMRPDVPDVMSGIVWQLQNLRPGIGSGVIDALGTPKSAWHGLALVLRPIAALISCEGLHGLVVHLINETALAHRRPSRTRMPL